MVGATRCGGLTQRLGATVAVRSVVEVRQHPCATFGRAWPVAHITGESRVRGAMICRSWCHFLHDIKVAIASTRFLELAEQRHSRAKSTGKYYSDLDCPLRATAACHMAAAPSDPPAQPLDVQVTYRQVPKAARPPPPPFPTRELTELQGRDAVPGRHLLPASLSSSDGAVDIAPLSSHAV